MLIRTLTAFLLFNNPQIPMQNSAEETIKKEAKPKSEQSTN